MEFLFACRSLNRVSVALDLTDFQKLGEQLLVCEDGSTSAQSSALITDSSLCRLGGISILSCSSTSGSNTDSNDSGSGGGGSGLGRGRGGGSSTNTNPAAFRPLMPALMELEIDICMWARKCENVEVVSPFLSLVGSRSHRLPALHSLRLDVVESRSTKVQPISVTAATRLWEALGDNRQLLSLDLRMRALNMELV